MDLHALIWVPLGLFVILTLTFVAKVFLILSTLPKSFWKLFFLFCSTHLTEDITKIRQEGQVRN